MNTSKQLKVTPSVTSATAFSSTILRHILYDMSIIFGINLFYKQMVYKQLALGT